MVSPGSPKVLWRNHHNAPSTHPPTQCLFSVWGKRDDPNLCAFKKVKPVAYSGNTGHSKTLLRLLLYKMAWGPAAGSPPSC